MPAVLTREPPKPENAPYTPFGSAMTLMRSRAGEVVLSGPAGTGKAQPLSATVWTPRGPVPMGSLRVGDRVLSPTGKTARVSQIHPQGEQPVYRLTFVCGDTALCTGNHLWEVHSLTGARIVPTHALTAMLKRPGYWVPQTAPVEFDPAPIPIPAYTLGALLGDGYLRVGELTITSADPEIPNRIAAELGEDYIVLADDRYHHRITGATIAVRKSRRKTAARGYVNWHTASRAWMARARTPGGGAKYLGTYESREAAQAVLDAHDVPTMSENERTQTNIWQAIDDLGLRNCRSAHKFVPECYRYNTAAVRLAVLRGLMDTDGTVDRKSGMPSFCSVSRQLAEDVKWLVESLGGLCRITSKQPPNGQLAYQCWIRYDDPANLFCLERKRLLCKKRTERPTRRYLRSIEPAGSEECQCITIDREDGLYLTDHFIVTHNSRACLEKLHACAAKYAGMRGLILRKTRESLSESALLTFETKVLPAGHYLTLGGTRNTRQHYHYRNGSEIVIGGLDKSEKIMSTEYDLIYVQEAIECDEKDWENATSRLRNGVMPYQQLMADTNPDAPHHWLKQRCVRGQSLMLESRHEENPTVTPEYIARLDKLTGVRYHRLRHGRWVGAEGMVYEDWDAAVHRIDRFPIPDSWPRYWAVDFGFTNPLSVSAWAAAPDGRLYCYLQAYQTQVLVEDMARQWLAATENDPRPVAIICDHDAEDRATLERHLKLPTTAAFKAVSPGLQAVAARLRPAGDGKPRLFFLRDSLLKTDPELIEKRKPTCAEDEMDSYIWDTRANRKKGEEPLKENDHALDALRYAVCYVDCIGGSGFVPWVGGTESESMYRSWRS